MGVMLTGRCGPHAASSSAVAQATTTRARTPCGHDAASIRPDDRGPAHRADDVSSPGAGRTPDEASAIGTSGLADSLRLVLEEPDRAAFVIDRGWLLRPDVSRRVRSGVGIVVLAPRLQVEPLGKAARQAVKLSVSGIVRRRRTDSPNPVDVPIRHAGQDARPPLDMRVRTALLRGVVVVPLRSASSRGLGPTGPEH